MIGLIILAVYVAIFVGAFLVVRFFVHRTTAGITARKTVTFGDESTVSPNRIAPRDLSKRARAQSSMISPRIAAIPPAAWRASARTSMQPPAAAAVRRAGEATQRKG